MNRHLFTVIATLAIALPASAADVLPPSVTVNGVGHVMARPDVAEINIGVASQSATASAALSGNNTAMAALIAALKAGGVDEKDILTSNFSVNPVYAENDPQYSGTPRPPKIAGYRVDNSVQVRVRNLANLGSLLDTVVRTGANNINGISFSVAQPEPVLDKARVSAIADARRKAELYAQAAGIKVGRVLYINESASMGQPPGPFLMRADAKQESVPIAVGEQEMQSSVQVIYAIEP